MEETFSRVGKSWFRVSAGPGSLLKELSVLALETLPPTFLFATSIAAIVSNSLVISSPGVAIND